MGDKILLVIAAQKLGWEDEKWMNGWPDAMTLEEIAQLEYTSETGYSPMDRRESALLTLLSCEADKGLIDWIKPEKVDMHPSMERMLEEVNLLFADLIDNDKYTGTKLIGREDYRHWDGRPNPPSDYIRAWLGESDGQRDLPALSKPTVPGNNDKPIRKRETQVRLIIEIAKILRYDPKDIPEKGKKEIKDYCLSNHKDVFTSESSFRHAWSYASKGKRISISDKKKYLRIQD